MLPMIGEMLDGQLRDNEVQLETLREGRERPLQLDDATLDHVGRVYREQLHFYGLYKEQLRRWSAGRSSKRQAAEVERLVGVNERNREVCQAILDLSAELREGTIDRLIEADDAEVGLAALLNLLEPPKSGQ